MTSATRLDGVGPALEERLADSGYRSLEELAHANLLAVCETKGADADLVLAAQEWLAENRAWTERPMAREAKRESWCDHCSKHLDTVKAGLRVHERRCAENPKAAERFK